MTSLLTWLSQRPFTLTLGSGFFGFFAHLGVVRALEQAGLKPSALTGASSGALVAGCYAAGVALDDMAELFWGLQRRDFWDPALGWGFLKGDKFRQLLRDVLPVHRCEQCPLPLRLSVYNATRKQTQIWQSGDLVDGIYASCAVPLLFHPYTHLGDKLIDGGVKDRPALMGLAPGERVLIHHLSSRSPWRRPTDPALTAPVRENACTLAVQGLARCGPFRLSQGRMAYEQALAATTFFLTQPAQQLMSVAVSDVLTERGLHKKAEEF